MAADALHLQLDTQDSHSVSENIHKAESQSLQPASPWRTAQPSCLSSGVSAPPDCGFFLFSLSPNNPLAPFLEPPPPYTGLRALTILRDDAWFFLWAWPWGTDTGPNQAARSSFLLHSWGTPIANRLKGVRKVMLGTHLSLARES